MKVWLIHSIRDLNNIPSGNRWWGWEMPWNSKGGSLLWIWFPLSCQDPCTVYQAAGAGAWSSKHHSLSSTDQGEAQLPQRVNTQGHLTKKKILELTRVDILPYLECSPDLTISGYSSLWSETIYIGWQFETLDKIKVSSNKLFSSKFRDE